MTMNDDRDHLETEDYIKLNFTPARQIRESLPELTLAERRAKWDRMVAQFPQDDAPVAPEASYKATTLPSANMQVSASDYDVCTRCQGEVPLTELASNGKNRKRSWCKACDAERRRKPAPAADPSIMRDFLRGVDERYAARAERREQGRNPFEACSAELKLPVGQALGWFRDVPVYHDTRAVAHQIARLCGEDSQVTTTLRSIADAAQMTRLATDHHIQILVRSGWLKKVSTPKGTTFLLCVGRWTSLSDKVGF